MPVRLPRRLAALLGLAAGLLVVAVLSPAAQARGTRVRVSAPAGIPARRALTVVGTASGRARSARLQQRVHGHWASRGSAARVAGPRHAFRLRWRAPGRAGRIVLRVVAGSATSRSFPVAVMRRRGAKGARVVLGAGQIASAPDPGAPGTLRLSGPVSVAEGDVVASGVTASTPDGFLGVATSVKHDGATTVVGTRPTTLQEAVPDGAIDARIGGASSSAHTAAEREPVDKSVTCEAGGSVKLEGYAEIVPSARFQAHWHWGLRHSGVDTASFDASVTARAGLDASASASARCALSDQQIAQLDPRPITVEVGPIPVVLVPRVRVYVSADASAGADARTGIEASATASAGLRYDHGDVSPTHDFHRAFTATPPTASASAHVGAQLKPVFDLLLYGVAGPEATFSAGLSFDADTTKDPWWKVTAPVKLSARLRAPVLDLQTKEWDVYSHTFDLAHAGGPFAPPPPPPPPPPPQHVSRSIYDYEVSDDLECMLVTEEDADHEFFTSDDPMDACGTFLVLDGQLYGPSTVPAGDSLGDYQWWTPVSQSFDGDGTPGNPWRTETTVAAGDTGVELTETDTYVQDGDSVATTYAITGPSGDRRSVRLYRAADCYVGDDDYGYGTYRPASATVGCLRDNGDNTETEMALVPDSPGATVAEAFFDDIWAMVGSQQPLPDSCRCGENIDNGFAASWAAPLTGTTTPLRLGSRFAFVTVG